MARTSGVRQTRECLKCSCGVHRGCTTDSTHDKSASGTNIPFCFRKGTAETGCPCIAADDKRMVDEQETQRTFIAENQRLMDEAAHSEKSMKIRLAAVEVALWGKSYEGEVDESRPEILSNRDSSNEAAAKRSRK